jgi:hypothetical protein
MQTYKCEQLVTYANVMQQINNSSCDVFTITDAPNIIFEFDVKKSQHVLTQMQTHLRNTIHNRFIFPFPKYELI